jgi:outer membrane protein OmpA-like peptidoglycan-associated protein
MKIKKQQKMKNLFVLIAGMCISAVSLSQNYLGVHASNFGGVMSMDAQPASFVDGRFKFDLTLVSFHAGGFTNAFAFDTKDMPKWWRKSFTPDVNASSSYVLGGTNPSNDWIVPDSTFTDRYFIKNYGANQDKPLGGYINSQVDILNFAFHIKRDIAIGFGVRQRNVMNIDNVDPKLAYLAENSLNIPSLWNIDFNEKLLDIRQMSWLEYGISYGQTISDKGEHFFKAGGELKFMHGLTAAYLFTDNFNYRLQNSDTTLRLAGDFKYGYSKSFDLLGDTNATFKDIRSRLGLGLDLGFVYEWRPDHEKYKYEMDNVKNIQRATMNKYKLRIGASLIDLGGMRFEKGKITKDFTVNSANAFDINTFQNGNSFADFDDIIDSLGKVNPTEWIVDPTTSNTFYMNTPTSFGLQVDYHIWKVFYVNATSVLNVNFRKDASSIRVPNQFSITPSLDHSWFGIHLPVTYNKFSGVRLGAATRLGPLTIGFTDLRAPLAIGKIKGGDVYLGLHVPILYSEPNDRDNDMVSDKLDACKDVAGVWDFKGCPDTDKDGIQDTEDRCPLDPGTLEFKGCSDKDGDKIADIDDTCPDVAGVDYFKGCPDVDKDSVMDLEDLCPTEKGLISLQGCPDRDGDGIKDSEDLCPDAPGPLANQGCPDTDNDGIYDYLDNCPTEAGPQENKGCPWADTDKDGLIDKDDECPTLAGPLKNKGCPFQDTDGDGILDKDDDCPTVKGVIENKGCPKIDKVEQEILNTAFENLEFNTGNAIIKEVSYASLDELAKLLVKKKEWKLLISGHTDNVGDDKKNMVLSKQRSEAVKAYLTSKGVDASRLITEFYGETKPIATNDTPEGRQRNRRVEMKVKFD